MFLELSENNNEIGLHSLLINLKYVVHDIRPYTMFQMTEENIIERSFETFRNWSIAEQTSYIESIFLRCSLQQILQ